MARSLSRILDQISRLQKQAAAIQTNVIDRIRKDIATYGLTVEQLFGTAKTRRSPKAKAAAKPDHPVKYADEIGNTWHGKGKRPDWLRQALEAGKVLDDFLVGKPKTATKKLTPRKSAAKAAPAKKTKKVQAAAKKPAPAKKPPAAKKAAPRKPRAKQARPGAAAPS